MEAIHAVGLTPISVVVSRKSEPRNLFSYPTNPFHRISQFSTFTTNSQKSFHGGLVLLSSFISSGFAKALTYEEALQQSTTPDTSSLSASDVSGILDSVISFGTENPGILAGGAALFAVPLVLSRVFAGSKSWGVASARNAYAALGEDGDAQLLDIRSLGDIRQVGSPDIRGLKKKAISVVYKGEDKPGFLKKLELKFKEPENTTLYILDKFDGSSELVAELVTSNGFKAAYAIKDGAEGSRGWMSSGLPWIEPKKTFSLDLSGVTEAIDGALGEGYEAISLVLGVAAATGLGLLAFTEVETILELLGSAAIIQLVSKKFLFAEDRKQTLKQLDDFLTTKVAPKELVEDVKQIGKALLPAPVGGKALPAPAAASQTEAAVESNSAPPTVEPAVASQTEAVAESNSAPATVEAASEATPAVNSAPKAEVETDSLPGIPRPLSPFPSYPDFRPPASPTPSRP